MGIAIYDRTGKVLAVTPELGAILNPVPDSLMTAVAQDKNESVFARLSDKRVHILAVPVHQKDQVVGGLAIVHDIAYIRAEVMEVWRQTFFHVLAQVFLIVLITL